MRLVLDTDPGILTVRRYAPGMIVVGEQVLSKACIVSATRLVADWEAGSPADLDIGRLGPLLELQPTIIILGILESHTPPRRALLSDLQERGIALETMSLGAACRTYNVLVSENRRVVAGLFPV